MLRAACDDTTMNAQLQWVLSLPNEQRQTFVRSWVNDMLTNAAPQDLVQAIACLLDDQVAEKAFEVIFQCQRVG